MSRHLSLRLDEGTFDCLERRRRSTGENRSDLVKRLLDEGLRMAEHPHVIFRDGPAGRRAGLVRGPDVWQVASVLRKLDESGDEAVRVAVSLLELPEHLVRAAAGYYAAYLAEVDELIDRNDAEAQAAEAAWRREQQLLA